MRAVATTLQVLEWAAEPKGPPPMGDLFDLGALLHPSAALEEALARSAAISAARLGLTAATLSGDEAIRPEALCLAAAIGGALMHPIEAMELLRGVPPPGSLWQQVVHHGLASPALRSAALPTAFGVEILLCSPLTTVLYLPPKGGDDAAITLCARLASFAEGRRLLVRRFANPGVNAGQLSWRGRVMAVMRLDAALRPLVLDIYEAAVALHGHAWRQHIGQGTRILANAADASEKDLNLALSIGRWWEPLRAIHAAEHQMIRERNHLEFHTYLAGIRLASAVGRVRGKQVI